MKQKGGVTNRQRLAGFSPDQPFKRGERVKVEFEHHDGTIKMYTGKFESLVEIQGFPSMECGIVRLSKSASLMTRLSTIEKCVGRLAGSNR